MEDILIAAALDLKGFPEVINGIFPVTEVSAAHHPPNPQFNEVCGLEEPKDLYGR